MKDKILQALNDLRAYALAKKYEVSIDYHEEDSSLMRFANSAVSLNTSEHLIRLSITAYEGRRRAVYNLITDLEKMNEMKTAVDTAADMVKHVQPLEYQPTVPAFTGSFADESTYDPALASLSNEEKLEYFNSAARDMESEDIRLSGIFSGGVTTLAQITTRSEYTQFFRFSDAQATVVLSHAKLKWEVQSEQSAHTGEALAPQSVHDELAFLLYCYRHDAPLSLPPGRYDIVFGPAAIADLIGVMEFIGYNGGSMKRGFSMLTEDKIGQKVLSDKFSLTDDPAHLETFPFRRDLTGIPRGRFSLFEKGVFKSFAWLQDDADEFGALPTGHTVMHKSLVLPSGEKNISTLEELIAMPRENDLLYIPFLHYMNVVNPSKGIVTGSSRFGALYLKKDGPVVIPYNVRLTQSLLDIFGDKVAWFSKQTIPYNTSVTYGARNPTAVIVPRFMCVHDLEISHSNTSY